MFVHTRHARELLAMQSGTAFRFVTNGIEFALEQAKKATGRKAVTLGDGAGAMGKYVAAGLLDEQEIHVMPPQLGGVRLFGRLDPRKVQLELLRLCGGRVSRI